MPRVFCIKALNKINLQNYCTVWARAFLINFKQCKNISVLTNMKLVRCRNNLQNTSNLSFVSYSGTIACLLRLNKFVHHVAIHSGQDCRYFHFWTPGSLVSYAWHLISKELRQLFILKGYFFFISTLDVTSKVQCICLTNFLQKLRYKGPFKNELRGHKEVVLLCTRPCKKVNQSQLWAQSLLCCHIFKEWHIFVNN